MRLSARVGIVVRTKDRPYFLDRAIRDILAQSYSGWRIVVANDGGDRQRVDEVVGRFEAQLDGRLTVVDVPQPGGRCAAANIAIRDAGTEFVVLHDDDDRWAPGFLTATVDWLDSHPGDTGVMVPTEIIFEKESGAGYVETRREPLFPGMSQITYYDMITLNRAVPISFLYRSAVHDSVGFYDETLDAVEDWDFYLRVLVDHSIGFATGEVLAYWSLRPSSRGAAGNSMFALGDVHSRFDTIVRDRAVRQLARDHGPGIPLLVAGIVERAVREEREAQRRRHPLRRLARLLLGRR